ncbi:hypothetical protein RHMOL_Rhmol08G0217200 [Rhododendron molle]|uniref:Uncharacterized protein n=1 Tax=Rhododendron molle TaxID=49168 RepID=A0ACC0MR74_RHOML|nr:hypothetical protein RHMOL_Rhmol08G0217200 [Rhododendron molle]
MIKKIFPLPHGQLKSRDTARSALKPFSTVGINVTDQTVNDISDCAMVPLIGRGSHGLVVPGILLVFIDAVNTVKSPGRRGLRLIVSLRRWRDCFVMVVRVQWTGALFV